MNTSQLLLVSSVGLAVNLFGMFAMGGHHHHVCASSLLLFCSSVPSLVRLLAFVYICVIPSCVSVVISPSLISLSFLN